MFILLQCHGDIEKNPGPRKLKKSLSVCHWNLTSLTAQFLKTYLAESIYFTTQKMKFSIKDFFSKCDQIRRELRI